MSKETAFYETDEFKKAAAEWNKTHPTLKVGGNAGEVKPLISKLKENGFDDVVSAEEFGQTQLENQAQHDEAIVYENVYSGATPMNKSGLPPCKQREEQIARGNISFDANFNIE